MAPANSSLLALTLAASTLLVHAADAAAGARALHFLGFADPAPAGGAVEVSPDGAHVYFTVTDGVSAYARNGSTGALSFVETEIDGLGPTLTERSNVAISPDGAHVYHTGANLNSVSVLARDSGTGALSFVESETDGVGGVTGLNDPEAIAVSPDGAHVYVSAESAAGETVVTFARDAVTGELTFVSAIGEPSFFGIESIAISPDGANVYVPAFTSINSLDLLAIFSRNPSTGELTLLDSPLVPFGGHAAISPDGTRLYHGGRDVLEVYRRDPADGSLELLEEERFGLRGVDGIFSISPPIRVSADGEMVYSGNVVGSNHPLDVAAIAAFAQNEVDELTFVEAEKPGFGSVPADGFVFFASFALSPDGAHVYTNRGGIFAASFPGCTAEPLAGCRSAGSSSLIIKDASRDGSDRAVWTWSQGDATSIEDFGDPDTIDHYALCVYDESGPSAALALGALAPAAGQCVVLPRLRDCWARYETKINYSDPFATPGGLKTMRLVPGEAGRARLRITAKGEDLETPALPLGLPIRAQLQNASGECWEASFATAQTNSEDTLKARSD
jgi:hypothetical protein